MKDALNLSSSGLRLCLFWGFVSFTAGKVEDVGVYAPNLENKEGFLRFIVLVQQGRIQDFGRSG